MPSAPATSGKGRACAPPQRLRLGGRSGRRGRGSRASRSIFFRTFFRQAAVKQGETRDRSLRARRPTGVRQDIALQRRAGVRVANVGGELAEARSERSLRCDCEQLRRGAGESSALRDAVEEGLSLLAPSPSNFEGQHRQATPPGALKLRVT